LRRYFGVTSSEGRTQLDGQTHEPRLRRLIAAEDEVSPEELISGLRFGDLAPDERPYLVLNMVTTLDGKATVEGRTQAISSEADRAMFHQLRTQVDAILVGATTVAVEGYGRMIKSDELRAKREREGLAADALAVVASARLNVPAEAKLLQEPAQRVVIATGSDETLDGVRATVEYARTGEDLPLLMARLRADHGVRSILCEGGPTLNSYLLEANLVDELFLTVAPQISGGTGAPTIVEGRPLMRPGEGRLEWLYEADSHLFARWRL
jgi:riboflavin-specific deaminase-like protein